MTCTLMAATKNLKNLSETTVLDWGISVTILSRGTQGKYHRWSNVVEETCMISTKGPIYCHQHAVLMTPL